MFYHLCFTAKHKNRMLSGPTRAEEVDVEKLTCSNTKQSYDFRQQNKYLKIATTNKW